MDWTKSIFSASLLWHVCNETQRQFLSKPNYQSRSSWSLDDLKMHRAKLFVLISLFVAHSLIFQLTKFSVSHKALIKMIMFLSAWHSSTATITMTEICCLINSPFLFRYSCPVRNPPSTPEIFRVRSEDDYMSHYISASDQSLPQR